VKRYSYRDAFNRCLEHDDNLQDFETVINATDIRDDLYFANYEKAPWHVQAEINGFEVNFWPHTMKAYCSGFGTVEGLQAIINMINEVNDEENVEMVE
tara:strand:+ start:8808 stop:9101 length:294 start_codon:yes stop_codon:yes gene_type:complete